MFADTFRDMYKHIMPLYFINVYDNRQLKYIMNY